jgi:hypothetical protein
MYRIIVMGATLAIVVMGWRLYGPSAAECKSIALKGLEKIESMLRTPDETREALAGSPPSQLQPSSPPAALLAASDSPPLFAAASEPIKNRMEADRLRDQSGGETRPTDEIRPVGYETLGDVPGDEDQHLKSLLARLAEFDVQELQLAPWGGSGQLFRFCCRASWGNSPQFSRHFESVAAEPALAVEQVLAQVSNWRLNEPAPQ